MSAWVCRLFASTVMKGASGPQGRTRRPDHALLWATAVLFPAVVLVLLLPVYAIQIVMAAVLVSLLVSMVRSRYLSRIAFRNLLRKRRTTILLVLGLSAGMVMITSSLVISDTVDNIVVTQVEHRMAGADLVMASVGVGNEYHPSAEMNGLMSSVARVDGVERVSGVVMDSAAVVDRDTGQLAPSIGLLGFNRSIIPDQLSMTSVGGLEIVREPQSGCAFISDDLAHDLGARTGDLLLLVKGNVTATFRLTSIVSYTGLRWDHDKAVFLGLNDCGFLSGMDGGVNTLVVSYTNDRPGMTVADSAPITSQVTDAVAAVTGANWQIVQEKSAEVQGQRQYFGPFLDLYFIFDAIFLLAGAVLISNILIMFAHERDQEMKVLRAMGMRSAQIVRMFVYEGAAYATLSSLLGVAAGCAAVIAAVQFAGSNLRIDGAKIDGLIVLSPRSLVLAFLIGLVIMLLIVVAVCRATIGSNRARDRDRPSEQRAGIGTSVRIGAMAVAYGAGSSIIGLILNSTWLMFTGATCLSFSLGPLLMPSLGGNRSWALAGAAMVLVWIPKPSWLGLPSLLSPGDLILSGIFLLAACLMVAVLLFDRIASFMMTHLFRRGRLGVISKIVFSNSARVRLRTGLGIAIFGLVVFTITITTIVAGMVNYNVPLIAEQATGGVDMIATTETPVQTNEMWARLNDSGLVQPGNVTGITGLYSVSAAVYVDGSGSESSEMIGIDPGFDSLLRLPLSDFDARYRNATDVWSAVSADPSLAIIDGSLEDEMVHAVGTFPASSAIGQNLSVMDDQGHQLNLTVVGVSRFNGLSSVFVEQGLVAERFGVTGPTVFLIQVADGLDPQQQSVLLEKALLSFGTYTLVIQSSVDRSLSDINGSLDIFQVQLFVGLGAGISGLVILTARSINERRAESGILRSLGFTRRMLAVNYCIETGLSASTGVLIGVLMGMFVGYNLWQTVLKGVGFQFYIPWSDLLLMAVGILSLVTVTLYALVLGMSGSPPAEDLRYE